MRVNPNNPYTAYAGGENEKLKRIAKKYLWRYKDLENEIKTLTDEINALEEQRDSITVKMDGMPHGSGKADKTATLASRTADLQTKQLELRLEALTQRAEIVDFIRQIPNKLQGRILYLHFVRGKTFEWIAEEDLAMSCRQVIRIYGDALVTCGKRLEK